MISVLLWFCYCFGEEGAMANSKVALLRRVRTNEGWRYYPAAYAANGKVKPEVVIVAGQEVKHPTGYYALRYYQGTKLLFEALKDASPAEAEAKRKVKEARMSAVVVASKAGIKIKMPDSKRKSLAVQLSQFLSATEDRGSLRAAEAYRLACYEFLKVIGRQYADEIVPEDVVVFQKALAERGMSVRTVSNRHTNVKTFLKFLGYDIKGLPKPPKYDKTLPEIYTDQELKSLFQSITSARESLLFQLLLQTGVREREAMFLEWDDIDQKRKILKLQSKVKQWGFRLKDFEERELPLSPELLSQLATYQQRDSAGHSPLIFERNGKPDSHMLRTLKQLARAADLNCGKCDGCLSESRECGNWYLHKFRASFCTKMHGNPNITLRTLQALMGHSDLASTLRYLRPAENVQTQAAFSGMKWY
jgi:integrase